jgi:hypothetical protein
MPPDAPSGGLRADSCAGRSDDFSGYLRSKRVMSLQTARLEAWEIVSLEAYASITTQVIARGLSPSLWSKHD